VMLRRPAHPTILALTALTLAAASPNAPARGATASEVNAAVERGKAYLYSQQKNGTWDEGPPPGKITPGNEARSVTGGQWTGSTALAVYALLACGERPHQEPRLATAVEFLKKNPTTGVYALGLRCQVWLLLPQTEDVQTAMRRDAAVLLNSVMTKDNARGMYTYIPNPGGKDYSHSRAQYGVLGVWAAERSGAVKVPDGYWHMVEQGWLRNQDASGGWTYMHPKETEHPVTPGMTAAAVATLFITQDYVHRDEGLACRGNVSNPAIERGLKWMADHMELFATDTRYPRDWHYPTLYAVERIGLAGGHKYLGKVDWYQKGADWLLTRQGKNGSWTGGGTPGPGAVGETAFAMLFLARGRAPVAFNKLDYAGDIAGPQAPPWNQRPRDVANVTRWIGEKVERELNWQIVNLQSPPEDLLEAPVLYVSGNKPLVLDTAARDKLRRYVEAGGLILGHADCGTAPFSTGFRKLAAEMFPAYEFRELPPDHPIYTGNFPRSKWRLKPSVLGLSNGARELMILLPAGDPARVWQQRAYNGKEELWQLPAAIFLYTSENKDLRFRGETHWVAADPNVKPARSLKILRLQYPGNWDPEPGGWRRLANVALNDYALGLEVQPVKLGEGKLAAAMGQPGPAVAHLTGTAKFILSEPARAELKRFVEGGGTLLIDAAGGASEFAGQVEAELRSMFPQSPLAVLPPDHKLYATIPAPGGGRGISVRYRPHAQRSVSGLTRSPRLQAVALNGRPAVIYSREDLSVGLVGQSVDGIIGYDPEWATELTAAALAHATGITARRVDPTTRPTTDRGATTRPGSTRPMVPRAGAGG